jgi:hypothetical protein
LETVTVKFFNLLIMPVISRLKILITILLAAPLVVSSQGKKLGMRILQDDSVFVIGAGKTTIQLQKKGFKIQVMLQNIKGIYSFASMKDSVYCLADESPVPGFTTLTDMIIQEEEYNREKELLVSNDGWCYWFYDPRLAWQGFNKKVVLLDSGRLVASKSVKHLYLMPSKRLVKLKDNHAPLYLFFVAVDEVDSQGRPVKELLRRRVKIEWVDED